MLVGLTGGVGSGKSTVSGRLAELGAVVVDADAISREVVEPGTSGLAALVERFGEGVLDADGRLDRPAVAAIVFNDDEARADLNAIVHPLVGARTAELIGAAAPDAVVIYDVPLLVESNMAAGFGLVIVVETDVELRIKRLDQRGMPEADARSRIAIQATDEQRRAVAGELIENNGTREELVAKVDAVWTRLLERQAAESAG